MEIVRHWQTCGTGAASEVAPRYVPIARHDAHLTSSSVIVQVWATAGVPLAVSLYVQVHERSAMTPYKASCVCESIHQARCSPPSIAAFLLLHFIPSFLFYTLHTIVTSVPACDLQSFSVSSLCSSRPMVFRCPGMLSHLRCMKSLLMLAFR